MKQWLINKGWIQPYSFNNLNINWKKGTVGPGYLEHGYYIFGYKIVTKRIHII